MEAGGEPPTTIPNGASTAGPSRLDVSDTSELWILGLMPLSISATNDSFYPPDNSFQVHRTSKSQPSNTNLLANPTRPLSSADEAGPAPKKLRSTTSQPEVLKAKTSKSSSDDPLKKARARPALSFANIFSSSGRRSQSTTSSRANVVPGKSNAPSNASNVATRRSSRLIGGNTTTSKPTLASKVITGAYFTCDTPRLISLISLSVVLIYSTPHESDGRDRLHIQEIGLPNLIKMKATF